MSKLFSWGACSLLLLSSVVSSCSSDTNEPLAPSEVASSPSGSLSMPVSNASESSTASIDISSLNTVALDYVNNAKTLLYATDAIAVPAPQVPIPDDGDPSGPSTNSNPMSARLSDLDIVDIETGQQIDFYSLPKVEREAFVENLLIEDAATISSRLAIAPEATHQLALENETTQALIQEQGLTAMSVGSSVASTSSTAVSSRSARSTTPPIKKIDHKRFFSTLQKRLGDKMEASQKSSANEARTISISLGGDYPKVSLDRVKAAWMKSARRGDFILAIPSHGQPWVHANLSSGVRFKVGHAGILDSTITSETEKNKRVTIEAYTSGVQRLRYMDWDTPHYVMGIQRVRYRWRWRGFRSGFRKVCTPVSNPGALADWANRYIGHEYVRWYEFLTAKWAAPKRFTCTTLVWWCSKKAYNINVSSWYSPLVSPSGLFTDDETYIRHDIQ